MEVTKTEIDSILDRWKRNPDYVIEILQDVQESSRYVPEDTVRYIADELEIPLPQVFHIATFYKAFSLEPKGEHEVQVCMGTACHVKGAPRVLDALARDLKIESGETTKDQKFSLDEVRCVGCCGLAPVVVVDEEFHSDVRPDKAAKVLKPYRKTRSKGR